MSSAPGIRAAVVLGGVRLDGISPTEVGLRKREVKSVYEGGLLDRREFLPWQEDGYPLRLWKREISLKYRSLRDKYDLVEEILAGPGPFDCVLWKVEHLVYIGDGVSDTFLLPWRVALQVVGNPPTIDAPKLEPEVRVGLATATSLTYAAVDAATFAGTPPAGTVWFLQGAGQQLKLPEPPAAGDLVYCRVIPVYTVLEREEHEKRYQGPTTEPRDLVLLET